MTVRKRSIWLSSTVAPELRAAWTAVSRAAVAAPLG
jgi:hypothetical protein